MKPKILKLVPLSALIEQARRDLLELGNNPDVDPGFLSDNDINDYVNTMVALHSDEWSIINDVDYERIF